MKSLQARHLKRWNVRSLLASDFGARALPWSKLILSRRGFVNDLNLTVASRLSVALAYAMVAAAVGSVAWFPCLWLAALFAAALLALNAPLYAFFARKRGPVFALGTIPWHWLYYLYSGLAFALALGAHVAAAVAPRLAPAAPQSASASADHPSLTEEDRSAL